MGAFSRRSRAMVSRTRPSTAWVLRRRVANAAAVRAANREGSLMRRLPVRRRFSRCFRRGRRCRYRQDRWRGTRWTIRDGSSPGVCADPRRGHDPGARGRGQCSFEAVDGAGGGLEIAVQVVGGGVVGCALGQLSPLCAFTSPIQQIGAGEHELVAVVAIQIPWVGPAVDDGLEGAKTTFGRCAAPRQVDREHLGLFASHRGRVTGEQFTGVGGAVFGDPDLLQYVLEIGIRQVDIVFGHAVADLAEISAGVGGLMRQVVGSVCYENTLILPGARLTPAMSRNSLAVKEKQKWWRSARARARCPGRGSRR